MKLRLNVTLLAVAIAVVGATANAMAPVIGAIKSPVISDDVPSTSDNIFVYPDAYDLDTLAHDNDDTVTDDAIIWSYVSVSGNYRINDQDSLVDPNDAVSPSASEDLSQGDDPAAVDANMRTITLRDHGYSPIGGPNTDPSDNGTSTVIRMEPVTFFASDGSSWSMKSVMFYTESDGTDRLSGASLEVIETIVPSQAGGWTSSLVGGTATLTDSSGLCIQTPGPGSNFALWVSAANLVDLIQNAVYRVRLDMDDNGTPITANATPFWDLVIDNNNNSGTGQNKYDGDFQNIDNEGGANSVTTRGQFDFWWCPPSITGADWNNVSTGEFTSAKDPENDFRLTFRALDVVNTAIDGSGDAGTMCVRSIEVSRIDIADLAVEGAPLYEEDTIDASTHGVTTIFGAANTNVAYASGNLSISPNTTGGAGTNAWDLEVITVFPGDGNVNFADGATLVDNYPVKWTANTLLKGTVTVQAPNAAGENTPPDVLVLLWDTPTNELIVASSVISSVDTLGLPKQAQTTDLIGFYYTHSVTLSGNAGAGEFDRIRLRTQILATDSILSGGNADNLGGITILGDKIEAISSVE